MPYAILVKTFKRDTATWSLEVYDPNHSDEVIDVFLDWKNEPLVVVLSRLEKNMKYVMVGQEGSSRFVLHKP